MKNLYSIATTDTAAFVQSIAGKRVKYTPAQPAPFDVTQTIAAESWYQNDHGVIVVAHWGDVAGPWGQRHQVYGLNRRAVQLIANHPLVRRDNETPVIDITPLPDMLTIEEATQ